MSFFQRNYQTPTWLKDKLAGQANRRQFLKSAAGVSAIAALPLPVLKARANASDHADDEKKLAEAKKTDPWLTINAVQNHLLPSSSSGPGAKEIQAFAYLYHVVTEQPTDEDEKVFIFKGVDWLNGYSQEQLNKGFVALSYAEKEKTLRSISGSRAGENWLNTLLGYIFEAMLSPPAYGGNPDGIGWQWLEHQAGFPLPKAGQRYYEIPASRAASLAQNRRVNNFIPARDLTATSAHLTKTSLTKAPTPKAVQTKTRKA